MGRTLLFILDCVVFAFLLICIITGNAGIEDYVFLIGTVVFGAYDLIKQRHARKIKHPPEEMSKENSQHRKK